MAVRMATATEPLRGRGRESPPPFLPPPFVFCLGYSLGPVFVESLGIRPRLSVGLAPALRCVGLGRLRTLGYMSQRAGVEGTRTATAK